MNELIYKNKNLFDLLPQEEIERAYEYAEGDKRFLDNAKTEREAVAEAIAIAKGAGFCEFDGSRPQPGAKIYKSIGGKALMLAVIGNRPLEDGANIAGAHVDSPRLDLKQMPLYEDSEIALFKTHYYGGIRKYQWVAMPLALHGVIAKPDGAIEKVSIGEEPDEPVFFVSDLLPHLGKDQNKKTLAEAFTGEDLNIFIGTRPTGGEKHSDRFKMSILQVLNEKYGMDEEDFLSAELEAVPAGRARDAGFDRSMVLGYGHDDRSCVYAGLRAICETENPEKTAICILVDKEEVGSSGVTGMQSQAFEKFLADISG
ncbi:MAG: aminopeptidase, partial [Clostridiales bacterium]|nr:aminopeptidase [Clostridiales bacterium]